MNPAAVAGIRWNDACWHCGGRLDDDPNDLPEGPEPGWRLHWDCAETLGVLDAS